MDQGSAHRGGSFRQVPRSVAVHRQGQLGLAFGAIDGGVRGGIQNDRRTSLLHQAEHLLPVGYVDLRGVQGDHLAQGQHRPGCSSQPNCPHFPMSNMLFMQVERWF